MSGELTSVLEALGLAILERDEDIASLRLVLSEALALARSQHLEIIRLKARVVELLQQIQAQRQWQAPKKLLGIAQASESELDTELAADRDAATGSGTAADEGAGTEAGKGAAHLAGRIWT